MSDALGKVVPLGDVTPARSRHQGRRSAVGATEETIFVGTADGVVRALDRETLDERWRVDAVEGSVVAVEPVAGGVTVGERGTNGTVCLYDADGAERWRHEAVTDLGPPTKETRFFLPFVASIATDGERIYAATRRYERDGERRHFESVVYAFAPDGTERWRYEADASPISLDTDGERVAVAYNRCPGDHQQGLVVFDAATGERRWTWDPGTDGQRRVGDVSLVDGAVAVASHGDYRGYLLDSGDERWTIDLATPQSVEGETVYAYPNHVHATLAGIVFVTGNTYPEEGRETAASHPREHTAVGVDGDGRERFAVRVGGFASGIGTDGDRLAVPVAQNFRERNPDKHACLVLDVIDGKVRREQTAGVVTTAAVAGKTALAVEEPVIYHDDGERRGAYRLHRIRS